MIITGNSVLAGAGITSNSASPSGTTGAPASSGPAKFYRPDGDVSRWVGGADSPAGNQDWKITKGGSSSAWYYLTPTKDGSQWEIQHPMPGPEDFFRYGLQVQLSCYFSDVDDETMEGKDLLEVRLVIPDDALPDGMTVPAATPDKPYLVVGFIVRCVGGKYNVYDPDAGITSTDVTTSTSIALPGSRAELGLRCSSGNFYGGLTYNNQRGLKLIRTGVNTPVNTLCIRSGANPVKETGFSYLESVVPREKLSHTLTPEDDNATFYCPWGYGGAVRLTLPDIPLPEGFRVNMIIENKSRIDIHPENKNVTCNQDGGRPSSDSMGILRNSSLMQTGKNGKEWLLIQ